MTKKKDDAPEVIEITDLAQLATFDFNVEIERNDGTIIRIPMRTLSFKEWNDVGREIPNPTAPLSGADRNGRPVYNLNDGTYRAQLEEANVRRAHRRLLASLKLDVPGETVEEKIAYLENLDFGIANKLVGVMLQMAVDVEGRVVERAYSFHDARNGRAAGVRADGVDAEAVE